MSKIQKAREILISSKNHHEQLGNELHILLQKYGDTTKDPGVIAKGHILDQNERKTCHRRQ